MSKPKHDLGKLVVDLAEAVEPGFGALCVATDGAGVLLAATLKIKSDEADLARLRAELGAARARVAELEDAVLMVIGEHGPLGKHGHLCNRAYWQAKVANDAGFAYSMEYLRFIRPPEGGGAS